MFMIPKFANWRIWDRNENNKQFCKNNGDPNLYNDYFMWKFFIYICSWQKRI